MECVNISHVSNHAKKVSPSASLENKKPYREGVILFSDAQLSIIEDPSRAETTGTQGVQWDKRFKYEVFARIVQQLHRLGWSTEVPKDHIERYGKTFALNFRYCSKGDLHADLELSGRCINFKMFQNVNAPDRPDHDGRHQSHKEFHAPYLMRLEMRRTRNRIAKYLCNVLGGYSIKESDPKIGVNGCTAMEVASHYRKTSGHYVAELDSARPDPSHLISGDGMPLANGMQVFALHRDGRFIAGKAFYSLNGNWQVVSGRDGLIYVWHKQLFVNCPENLKVKRNSGIRRKRLEAEMAKAISAMKFERAAVLRDILFPGDQPLFMVWSKRHNLYHRTGFSGYTSNTVDAGKFTETEVKTWSNQDNEIIPVANNE